MEDKDATQSRRQEVWRSRGFEAGEQQLAVIGIDCSNAFAAKISAHHFGCAKRHWVETWQLGGPAL